MSEKEHDQLAELKKLTVRGRKYKIPKQPRDGEIQAELMIYPLSLDDMDIIEGVDLDSSSTEEKINASKKMLAAGLGVSLDELKSVKLSFEYLMDVMDCISEVNKLEDENAEKVDKIKNFMKQNKEQFKK